MQLFWCTVFFTHQEFRHTGFFPRIMNLFGNTALMANCFFTYYEFGHTALLTYWVFFVHILWIWTFCSFGVLLFPILWIRTYCSFDVLSFFHILWIRTYFFLTYYEFLGHTVLLVYCFSHIMNSDILLFWTQLQILLDSAILIRRPKQCEKKMLSNLSRLV